MEYTEYQGSKSKLANNNSSKKSSGWRRHFAGKNLIINIIISFIPASIAYTILSEMGFGGVLVLAGLMFVFIYLSGTIFGKIVSLIKKSN